MAKRTGRPSKLEITPKIRGALCDLIRDGNPIKTACDLAGIGEATFRRWMADGEKPRAKAHYRAFRADVLRARAEKIDRLVRHIEHAGTIKSEATGQVDWKAAAWLLEHTEREQFHRREEQKVEVKDDRDPRGELDRIFDRLSARARAKDADQETEPTSS